MTCNQFEILLADYLDGTLPAGERAAFEVHAASCPGCAEFLADARVGLSLVNSAHSVIPPPDLVTRIAYLAPMGRSRGPAEQQGFFSKVVERWVQPILQPRFAMGMAMTILSFAMLERCTGVHIQRIQSADLNPVRILVDLEDRGLRLKDRAVKYYENIRFVYDIEVRLRELEQQQAEAQEAAHRRKPPAASPVQGRSAATPQAQGPASVPGPGNGPASTPAQGDGR